MQRQIITILSLLLLAGCETTQLQPQSKHIRIRWDTSELFKTCEDIGMVVGSEGSWYSFWFISNGELTEGALNSMMNQAAQRGANVINLYNPKSFSTSVTLMGNAYHCP